MGTETENESLEESIFKTLSNQKRRDILRFIGEHKQATFTEIKRATQIEDSSSVSYHLSSLKNLVFAKDEKYSLSELGKEAYNLIIKTNAYTSASVGIALLRKRLTLLVLANALIWLAALFVIRQFEGGINHATTFGVVALWLTSNALIYVILQKTGGSQTQLTQIL